MQPLTIYISRMDAETVRTRGRCTLTAYAEPVGNEVAFRTFQAPEGAEWAGAVAFIQHAQNAAGSAGADGHWPDEFLRWYKPEDWAGEHRAAAVFIGAKIAALAAQPQPQPKGTADELADEKLLSIWRKHYPSSVPGQLTILAARDVIAADRAIRPDAPGSNVPAGMALVPLEPTPEMRKAAVDAWLDCGSKLFLNKAAAALKAGIAAAPAPVEGS